MLRGSVRFATSIPRYARNFAAPPPCAGHARGEHARGVSSVYAWCGALGALRLVRKLGSLRKLGAHLEQNVLNVHQAQLLQNSMRFHNAPSPRWSGRMSHGMRVRSTARSKPRKHGYSSSMLQKKRKRLG